MLHSIDVSASALKAQRIRMLAISSNLANLTTTRNEDGEVAPYKPRYTLFQTDETLGKNGSAGVFVKEVVKDDIAPLRRYQPDHPDAGPDGYVLYPRINMMTEFTDALEAQRSYEANLGAMEMSKDIANQSLKIIG